MCSISQEHTTTVVSSLQMSYHPAFWCLLLSPVGMHAPLARGDFAVPAFPARPSPQLIYMHNTNASTSAPLPAIASSTSDSNACFWILYVTGITVTLLGPQRFPSLLACPCGFAHMSLPTAPPCTTKPAHTLSLLALLQPLLECQMSPFLFACTLPLPPQSTASVSL